MHNCPDPQCKGCLAEQPSGSVVQEWAASLRCPCCALKDEVSLGRCATQNSKWNGVI